MAATSIQDHTYVAIGRGFTPEELLDILYQVRKAAN
jgi:hypothetical protein